MDKKKKITLAVAGIGLAGLAYFLFFKKDETTEEWKRGGKDGLDNPMTGPYMGDKPRSVGNSTTTTTVGETKSGFDMCIPAMESEGGGMGKYISVDEKRDMKDQIGYIIKNYNNLDIPFSINEHLND